MLSGGPGEHEENRRALTAALTRLGLVQPRRHAGGHPVAGVGRQRHGDVDRVGHLDHGAVFVQELNADHGQRRQVRPAGLRTWREEVRGQRGKIRLEGSGCLRLLWS